MTATARTVVFSTSKSRIERVKAFHQQRRGGSYEGHGEDHVTRFHRLLRRWRAETSFASSLDVKFGHPAYQAIVDMGWLAVPLIISEIRRNPDWIFGALPQITGEDPVSDADRGDLDAMTLAWTHWGARRQ